MAPLWLSGGISAPHANVIDVVTEYLSKHSVAKTVLLQIMKVKKSGDDGIWDAILDYVKTRNSAS